jgi:hypothetical protein
MSAPGHAVSLEEQIDQWKGYVRRRQASRSVDVEALERQLRAHVDGLVAAGLATDEAFLLAVKRMGSRDPLAREFAREQSGRLWKQLVLASGTEARTLLPTDAVVAFCLAVAAAVLVKAPALFGLDLDADADVYLRNASFFVLPLLTGYFVWKRRLGGGMRVWLAAAFVLAAVVVNVYPFAAQGYTLVLAALHLPIALWLVVGVAHTGGRWSQPAARMDFVRFSGELFIYYVLIALGGVVFMGCMAAIFQAIGIDVEEFVGSWLVPCGATGAVLVASWLAEAKQSVVENMAPVLTRLFTPLFALMMIVFLGTLVVTGRALDIERDVLIVFDLLLGVVVGLLLYSVSARDSGSPPNMFDGAQVALVVSALVVDAVALWAIAARISEFGFSPNRVAALGENVILLVNLAWSAVLYVRFMRGRASFAALERWQTSYLPVYAAWAAIVVSVFPPVFGFV